MKTASEALGGWTLGSPSSSEMVSFLLHGGVAIIFHSLIYILFKKRVSLWSWPGLNTALPSALLKLESVTVFFLFIFPSIFVVSFYFILGPHPTVTPVWLCAQ